MNSIAQSTSEIKMSKSTTYSQRSGATRSRRAKAGRYPTRAQKAAFAKLVQRDGEKSLTKDDCEALSTHPHLAFSQRTRYAEMAESFRSEVA
jgi:hypothetical protein